MPSHVDDVFFFEVASKVIFGTMAKLAECLGRPYKTDS